MRDPWDESELARRFDAHSRHAFARAPLNAALAGVIARHRDLYSLLGHAPSEQQLPVMLLAAIHDQVLLEPDHELARWYPNLVAEPRQPDDPALATTLRAFVRERAPAILEIVGTRHVQTNEVGRCALLLPAFALIGADAPLAHLDVGASAGLNLLLPSFSVRYDGGEPIGPRDATVGLSCDTRGDPPLALDSLRLPDITGRCGIDARPIDVTDPAEARWLEACCWPDQADRFRRLRAAIELAQHDPPELLAGDAVESVGPAIERMATRGHPVVTTTWALNYLGADRRARFVDELDRLGAATDLSWVFAESPALTPELPHSQDLRDDHLTELSLVTWRGGVKTVRSLAETHPHGYWIHWI